MTKEFYISFLNYISLKELKRFYSCLCRKKISVNGFTPPKTPKAPMLAPLIIKNERVVFDILEESYAPNFNNCDDAANAFTPNMAITCLAYFVKVGMTDETFLMSLLEKKEEVREECQLQPETSKVKKKAEEFREKYLSTKRDLSKLRETYAKLQTENDDLKTALRAKEDELKSAIEAFQQLQTESIKSIDGLKQRVQELEADITPRTIDLDQGRNILVVSDTEDLALPKIASLNIDILNCENIANLKDIVNNYDEICVLESDIPFSAKCKLRRTEGTEGKIQPFSSKSNMIIYLKKKGGNTNGGSL